MTTPDHSTPQPQVPSARHLQYWRDRSRRERAPYDRQLPSLVWRVSEERLLRLARVPPITAAARRREAHRPRLFDWLSRKLGRCLPRATRVSPKYAIERRLGGGGMAEVFLARAEGAEGFTRWVALKRVLPGLSENPGFTRMFVYEAQLTSRLRHPNLVSVLDFDRGSDGRLFLVMELVEGVDLDGLLETGPLSFPLIIYLAIEILSGLRYAHDLPRADEKGVRGLVHRDISPHNILLSWEGEVKISDFGIAKSRAASYVTASGIVRGKPAYMSPEQANGEPLDGRSDLFSVGVMLWEMLCQRPLFREATAQETIARMLFAPIPSPSDVRPEIPEDLSRVVLQLLARDRTQRTPNADAAITQLIACADHARNGRQVLIQALADRFAGSVAAHARGVGRCSPVLPRRGDARRPVPAKPADGGPATLTEPPGVVLDPVAPPVPKRRRTRRRRAWMILASVAIAGTLVDDGLSRSGAKPKAAVRTIEVGGPGTPAPGAMSGEPARPPRAATRVLRDAPIAPAAPKGGSGSDGGGGKAGAP